MAHSHGEKLERLVLRIDRAGAIVVVLWRSELTFRGKATVDLAAFACYQFALSMAASSSSGVEENFAADE